MKISVLVAVYNVENTLERTIESILKQTFTDYEIILIDDGSTDNSGRICDEYAKKYPFISVIHKENEGLGLTRNAGVRAAQGEYIYHCDSDDWLDEVLLEKAYENAKVNNSDIVNFGYKILDESDLGYKLRSDVRVASNVYKTNEEVKEFFLREYYNNFVAVVAWTKLIRREFLLENDIWFTAHRKYEDIAFAAFLFSKAEVISTINESYYNYFNVAGLYKGRHYEEIINTITEIFELVEDRFKKWNALDDVQHVKLNQQFIAYLANHTAYYMCNISQKIKEDLNCFINHKTARKLMLSLNKKQLNSNFLWAVKVSLLLRSKSLLMLVFKILQKKNKRLYSGTSG